MEKKLSELKPGEAGVIKSVAGSGKIRRRMFDMGITPGAVIELKKLAPLGDPIEISIRGYSLSLRKADASLVVLEVTA